MNERSRPCELKWNEVRIQEMVVILNATIDQGHTVEPLLKEERLKGVQAEDVGAVVRWCGGAVVLSWQISKRMGNVVGGNETEQRKQGQRVGMQKDAVGEVGRCSGAEPVVSSVCAK